VSVALVTQHVKRKHRFVVCGLFGCTKLSYKRHDFRKEDAEHEITVLILSAKFV